MMVAAVVEDPPADPDAQQPPDHVLERGAVEELQVAVGATFQKRSCRQKCGRRSSSTAAAAAGTGDGPLDQHEVGDGEQQAERQRRGQRDASAPSPA